MASPVSGFGMRPLGAVRAARRRGSLLPAIATALLVTGMAALLVLDRLWVDAARMELITAAEAAALAGVSQLADDALLRDAPDLTSALERARASAARVAQENRVAGRPLIIDPRPGGDVRIGRIVEDPFGREVLLETDERPTSVAVFARRKRDGADSISLLLQAPSDAARSAVEVVAEATIDGRVIGVTGLVGGRIPALPLAILDQSSSGGRTETWTSQIEQRGGADRFGVEEGTDQVVAQPDGIPEIELRAAGPGGSPGEAAGLNVCCLDFGSALRDDRLAEQARLGLSADDLAAWSGVLKFDSGPLPIVAQPQIHEALRQALRECVGQKRIWFLYSGSPEAGSVLVGRIVAGRILSIEDSAEGGVEMVVQPCVLATRTAIVASAREAEATGNGYVYKVHLTY